MILEKIVKHIQNYSRIIENTEKQKPYYFSINDKIIYHQHLLGRLHKKHKGTVISYNPSHPIPRQRVCIKTESNEVLYVKDTEIVPLINPTIDHRTRLYIKENSPYKELHSLFNDHILCYPIPLGVSFESDLFLYGLLLLTPHHVIAIPNKGFIYLCSHTSLDSHETNYFAHIRLYNQQGELKQVLNYTLEKEDYESLFVFEEVAI